MTFIICDELKFLITLIDTVDPLMHFAHSGASVRTPTLNCFECLDSYICEFVMCGALNKFFYKNKTFHLLRFYREAHRRTTDP